MTRHATSCAALVVAISSLAVIACDPVKSDAIAALGGEAAGVRRGPLHRPGQPCLLCHDGDFGDPPAFSVAGTIYETPADASAAVGAVVFMTDSVDGGYEAGTNAAGNFYLTPDEWSPTFPLTKVVVMSAAGVTVTMQSDIGRSGSCATCHFEPTGVDSPGHVCVRLEDGGVPP